MNIPKKKKKINNGRMICIERSRNRQKNRMRWREWKICQTKRLYKPINNSQINHLYSSETLQMFTPSFVYCLTCAYHGRYWNVSYYTNISAFLFSFYSILILLSTLSHSFQCHKYFWLCDTRFISQLYVSIIRNWCRWRQIIFFFTWFFYSIENWNC